MIGRIVISELRVKSDSALRKKSETPSICLVEFSKLNSQSDAAKPSSIAVPPFANQGRIP